MKLKRTIITGFSALVLACSSATAAELRTWTDTQGRQVEAAFVKIEGEDIQLQTADGTIHRFPVSRLSAEDQNIARGMKAPEASADAPPSGTPDVGTGITGFPYPTESYGNAARQIDVLVAKGIVTKANKIRAEDGLPALTGFNPAANDEQFVRRIYLDLIGRIPSYEESRLFLKDADPMKRSKLINQLLDSEGYSSHMFNYFAEVLRVRHNLDQALLRGDDYVNWLRRQTERNRPWDQMVYAMLTAEGKMWTEDKNAKPGDPGDKGAAGYLLRDAGMPLDNLANTLTIFLGTDVACAQCHDHPFADWTQMQFYEMAAFFGATTTSYRNRRDSMELMKGVEEMVNEAGLDFTRLDNGIRNFIGANGYSVKDLEANMLKLPHDYKYKDGQPGDPVKPKFITWSPQDKSNPAYRQSKSKDEKLRHSFAAWATHPENPRFAMTIANRMWKRAFGSGVAEPVTNIDDPEAASNPELLKYLAEVMKKVKFDLKEFQRIIYNTRAYQSEATTEAIAMGSLYFFQGPQLRRMSAEQTWDSYMTLVLGKPEAYKAPLSDLYGKSIDLNVDNENLTAKDVLMKYDAFRRIAEKERALMGGGLESADDSMMMMGGSSGATAAAAEPAGDGAGKYLTYGGMRLLRASELPQPERGGHFLAEFGQSPRQLIDGGSKTGSVPQVLMMMNGGAQEMLTNRQSLIFRAMDKVEDPAGKTEALFLSVMSRKPTEQEQQIAKREVEANGEQGYANMIWALINTREFIFIQ
jgi:hypothetical protein